MLGRGIIHEPDDFRPDNPPSNPALLAFLEQELIHGPLRSEASLSAHFELADLSAVPYLPEPRIPEARPNFAYYPCAGLEAEVLIDALCQITGTTEQYTSLIPEPYTFIT